jgi:hypothetical protein
MQKSLVCKALLLEELVFKVLLVAGVVMVVTILAVFLLSPASLVVLAGVLNPLILCQVY